jgi:hypothetical protein
MVEDRRSFGMGGIDSLTVAYGSARVSFHPVDGDELVLVERRRNVDPSEVKAEGESLSITGDRRAWIPFVSRRLEAEIGIPRSWRGNYRITNGSGSISTGGELVSEGSVAISVSSGNMALDRFSARELTLHASSGSIEAGTIRGRTAISLSSGSLNISGLEGEGHRIESSSGSVRIDRISGGADIEVSSGSLRIGSLEGERHRLRSASGSIKIDSLSGAADFIAHSGEVTVGLRRLTGNLSFDLRSGGLDLTIPREEAFNLDAESSSGRIRVFSPEGEYSFKDRSSVYRPMGENPQYTILVRIRSGGIDIHRN